MRNKRDMRNKLVWLAEAVALLCALFLYSWQARAADLVCAVVKIEIRQELTLERQAFDAEMRINNGLDEMPLENVSISVTFEDENGNAVLASSDPNATDAVFFIRVDRMSGIDDTNGSDMNTYSRWPETTG